MLYCLINVKSDFKLLTYFKGGIDALLYAFMKRFENQFIHWHLQHVLYTLLPESGRSCKIDF